jgi:hypothetical protein
MTTAELPLLISGDDNDDSADVPDSDGPVSRGARRIPRGSLHSRQPDICLTMVPNPNWPEIANAIPTGSDWKRHPDIVSSVFNVKLNALIELICGNHIFGNVSAHYFRIEWQVVRSAIYIARYIAKI